MMPTLYVSTRKGLFTITRHQRGMWSIEDAAFLGDSVSLMLPDRRDGARYVAFGLGHFGVKLRRSRDHGETWDELAAPAFPPMPLRKPSPAPPRPRATRRPPPPRFQPPPLSFHR